MRVITGSAKHIQLISKDPGTVPLSDRAKTALFDIIHEKIPESSVLDIYAGSGALGIESLSRGAKNVVFVDISRASVGSIEINLKNTNLANKAEIIREDALRYTEKYIYETFDIIFVCPPYPNVNYKVVRNAVNLLNPGGILVFEHHKRDEYPDLDTIEKVSQRTYGIVQFEIYQKNT